MININALSFLADEPTSGGGMPSWVMWVILGAAFVLMIAMTIIPRKKQQKQTQNMMNSLKVGDKIMTIGRIVGDIVAIDDANNTVTIQSGEGEKASILVIDKLAIGMVVNQNGAAPAAAPVAPKKEEKEEEAVVVKTAKESMVAEALRKHKKGGKAEAEEAVKEATEEIFTSEPVIEPVADDVKNTENK